MYKPHVGPRFVVDLSVCLHERMAASTKIEARKPTPNPEILGLPAPRAAAVKELHSVHSGKCRGFFVKFLAVIFPGNGRTKICETFRQNFAIFFAGLLQKFRRNFALGDDVPNEIPHKHRVYASFSAKFARTFAVFPVT